MTFMIALLAYEKRFASFFPRAPRCYALAAGSRASALALRSPVRYLYRILAVAAITLPLVVPSTCAAQKKARARIRALAVLELPATVPIDKDLKIPATARLHAISIFQNKTYQDATIYYVNPVPMALEPGTVYDVQQNGESLGLFTIESTGKSKDDWLASGKWKSAASIVAAKKAPSSPVPVSLQDTDERPHLKHGGSASPASQPASTPAPTPSPTPTSAQPAPTPTPAEAAAQPDQQATPGSPSAGDADPSESDPNRPALRRRASAGSEESTAPTQVERKREAERKPEPVTPEKGVATSSVPPLKGPAPVLKRRGQGEPQFLVAISDATAYDTHSYKFPWTADEKQRLTDAIEKQALAELTAYAGKSTRVIAADSFTPSIQAFDLDYDNDAELVLTAKCALRKKLAPAKSAPLNAYITYVVRQESSGDLRKLFSEITDDDHMDVIGKLQFIDAVDADGDSHAELLFRRLGPTTQSFEFYRAGRDQLWKLFEGAESSR
ncbi:MAG TPA: hypothetical protein VK738_11315 [Terriglobales bacterium]|nr:hypothetical protein [Terriglobales bacterium]